MLLIGAIIAGFLLDLVIGDPHGWPHPIIFIGKLIAFLEKKIRAVVGSSPSGLRMGGRVMVVIVCFMSFIIPWLILYAAARVNLWLAVAIEAFMCYQIFCVRSLRDESMKVYYALKDKNLPLARKMLSWIVGRDTADLNEEELTKGAVETVAENTADGIFSPMLYMFIGGAPLAFLYKGINTMDSMVGYKNEKYIDLGRCAALLDDVANYIPARICAYCMIVGSYFAGFDAANAWKIYKRDRYNHLSPNSAMTESVAAGAMRMQLGGDHYYFGKMVHKATIGDPLVKTTGKNIKDMNRIMYFTSFVGLVLFALLRLAVIAYIIPEFF